VDGEDVDQSRQAKQPKNLPLRGREQQVTPGVPGLLAHSGQRCEAAGVNELQTCQVDDHVALAGRDYGKLSHDSHGDRYVKLPAQHYHNLAIALAGYQIHTAHCRHLPDSSAKAWSRLLHRAVHGGR
jgi:hypothetical protein